MITGLNGVFGVFKVAMCLEPVTLQEGDLIALLQQCLLKSVAFLFAGLQVLPQLSCNNICLILTPLFLKTQTDGLVLFDCTRLRLLVV